MITPPQAYCALLMPPKSNIKVERHAIARPNRGYFIPNHRIPPTLTEDDAARPLQRKLDLFWLIEAPIRY